MPLTPEQKLERDELAFRLLSEGRRIEYAAMKCRTSVKTVYPRLGPRVQEARVRAGKARAVSTRTLAD